MDRDAFGVSVSRRIFSNKVLCEEYRIGTVDSLFHIHDGAAETEVQAASNDFEFNS
jgi:hypothetical protein